MEQQPGRIFIIKPTSGSMTGAETYLKNRGWQVASGSSLKDCLQFLMKNRPDFVLITADHKNKKINMLPKVLKQAFGIYMIAYSEVQTSASYRAIENMAVDHRIFQTPSGPTIERTLRAIQKEIEEAKNKPENVEEEFSVEEKQQQAEKAKTAFSQLMGGAADGNDEDSAIGFTGSGNGTPGSGIGNGFSALEKNGSKDFEVHISKEGSSPNFLKVDGAKSDGFKFTQESGETGGFNFNQSGGSAGPDLAAKQSGPGISGEMAARQNGISGSHDEKKPAGFSNASDWEGLTPDYPKVNKEKGNGHWQAGDPVAEKGNGHWQAGDPNSAPTKIIQNVGIQESGLKESVMSQAVDQAVKKTVIHSRAAKEGGVEKILEATKAACILVNSAAFTGYVIAVLGKDRPIDDEFMVTIRGHLVQYLKDQGHDLDAVDLMNLQINQVEFNSWALEKAEFLKTTVHDDKEISVAFFAVEKNKLQTKFEESKNISKLKVNIADLKANTPVEFDLYLHLEANDKYILYTPENFPIYENQLSRLKDKGVGHIHIRKEQAGKVRKYNAQNFLNDKIASYQQKKTDPKSA